jgi:hypothetical protein
MSGQGRHMRATIRDLPHPPQSHSRGMAKTSFAWRSSRLKADARYSITLSGSTRIDCWICIPAPQLGDARSRPN